MNTGFLIIIRKSQTAKFTIRMFEAVSNPFVLEESIRWGFFHCCSGWIIILIRRGKKRRFSRFEIPGRWLIVSWFLSRFLEPVFYLFIFCFVLNVLWYHFRLRGSRKNNKRWNVKWIYVLKIQMTQPLARVEKIRRKL